MIGSFVRSFVRCSFVRSFVCSFVKNSKFYSPIFHCPIKMNPSIRFPTVLLILLQLFVFSNQVPSVNCGTGNVLEGFELDSPKENCDDKFVCELECKAFRKYSSCKYKTFLDLTKFLEKDKNNKMAYNQACQSGILNGDYLANPVSLKFRHIVGYITHISQKSFYHTYMKNKISFKKYPNLYKTPMKIIRKLPLFHNKKFMKSLILFESRYVQTVIKKETKFHQHIILAMYQFVKGLMGSKKLCFKHFESMKDKSEKPVASMIVNEIQKQMKEAEQEAKNSKGRVCDSFCKVDIIYLKFIIQNQKWKNYFDAVKKVLLDLFAHDLAKKMIRRTHETEVTYCNCKKISSLNFYINIRVPDVVKNFDKGFNLNGFSKYVSSICNSKCENDEEEEEEDD
jgi:hypothetical protein